MKNLKLQLKDKLNVDRAMTSIIIHLFNSNIKDPQYRLSFPTIGKQQNGLQIVESYIGDLYHLDLKRMKEGKEEYFWARPGDDNIWYLLAITAELYKLKL